MQPRDPRRPLRERAATAASVIAVSGICDRSASSSPQLPSPPSHCPIRLSTRSAAHPTQHHREPASCCSAVKCIPARDTATPGTAPRFLAGRADASGSTSYSKQPYRPAISIVRPSSETNTLPRRPREQAGGHVDVRARSDSGGSKALPEPRRDHDCRDELARPRRDHDLPAHRCRGPRCGSARTPARGLSISAPSQQPDQFAQGCSRIRSLPSISTGPVPAPPPPSETASPCQRC